MCRHLARVGPEPVTLASLLLDAPHSLLVQSHAPCDMRGGGTVNADGFGVGWVRPADHHGDGLGVYRRDDPLWTDASFHDVAYDIRSTALVAAVRSATVGMPVSTAACAPFRGDGWLFSHNGVVRGWPDSTAALAATLPPGELLRMDAPTDSALLWALIRARLRAGLAPEDAVAEVVRDTLDAAPGSRLNLLLGDGERIVATAVDHALSVLVDDDGTVTVASEPLDGDPGWQPVPDGSLLVAHRGRAGTPARLSITALDPSTAASDAPDLQDVTAKP